MSKKSENKTSNIRRVKASAAASALLVGIAAPAAADVGQVRGQIETLRAGSGEVAVDHGILSGVAKDVTAAQLAHTNGHGNVHTNGGGPIHTNGHGNVHTNNAQF